MQGRQLLLSFCLLLLLGQQVLGQSDSLPTPKQVVVNNILITGNKVTKRHIVLRELTFRLGDTLQVIDLSRLFERSSQNLINTSLFNFAVVKRWSAEPGVKVDPNKLDVHIILTERWYLWPNPIFEIAETNFNTWWLTRDFRRVNYGMDLVKNNFRGRDEDLILSAQFGYTRRFGVRYRIPYLNKKQKVGASFMALYKENREIVYQTLDNKRVFFSNETGNVRKEVQVRLRGFYRKNLYTTHRLEARFNQAEVNDSIPILSPNYLNGSDDRLQYLSLTYTFVNDRRDNKPYPLKGNYFRGWLVRSGLGLLTEDINLWYSQASFKTYHELAPRFYFAAGVTGKYTFSRNLPYYFQEGLGYGNTFVRGYEFHVIDGQNWGLFKSNLKFQLVKPKVEEIPFIASERFRKVHYAFYLNLFADAGFVGDRLYQNDNPLANEYLFGTGVGLDFVTYYDKIMRLEYSFNRLGESGFFIHFVQPI